MKPEHFHKAMPWFRLGKPSCRGLACAILFCLSWFRASGADGAPPASVVGAIANEEGPIGGGRDYRRMVTNATYTVHTLDELLQALDRATPGQSVRIPGDLVFNLTARIYIEEMVIEIPAGVTLAGDRGWNGSQGALLFSDALKTPVMIRAMGPGVRITGLRLQGPNGREYPEHVRHSMRVAGEAWRDYYYKLPLSKGITTLQDKLEVDNCEISAFSFAGISLDAGAGHHIHHNSIHHCQYSHLGYGVMLDQSEALIEYNLFDWNRHSIAGTGKNGSKYTARHNIQGEHSSSHCFDMHGGRDRRDGTDQAGTVVEIYNNTFLSLQTPVCIRGVPSEKCVIHSNWSPHFKTTGNMVISTLNRDIRIPVFRMETTEADSPADDPGPGTE